MTTTNDPVTYDLRDRASWGPGPWDHEPDRIEWRDEATGLPCMMLRNGMGAWCGYVAVPPGHPWHGVDFASSYPEDIEGPEVHGGVTYSQGCSELVCHQPGPGEPDDVWWLGFDCSHGGDLAPGLRAMQQAVRTLFPELEAYRLPPDVYRTQAYVEAEVASLARQVRAAGAG